ncbi:MAG: type II toxin-antitoxin system PemK/MazF family toxin [Armatimonadota bacterium]
MVATPRAIRRGEVWWADLPEPAGSGPGYRRPVLIVQTDSFNQSRVQTVVTVILTSNLRLAKAPGNVLVKSREAGLQKDSVVNVSQIYTIDRAFLSEHVGGLSPRILASVDAGLRLVLNL